MAYYATTMRLVVHNNQIELRREEERGGERKADEQRRDGHDGAGGASGGYTRDAGRGGEGDREMVGACPSPL